MKSSAALATRPISSRERHRWGLNLWVTDGEEAAIRSAFARRIESLAEAARRLLLDEIHGTRMMNTPREVVTSLRDYEQVKNLLNGDTCNFGDSAPVATRLFEFLHEQGVAAAWDRFNRDREKL